MNASPVEIVPAATRIPLFIGYTEFAPKTCEPVSIASVEDFVAAFGGAAESRYYLPTAIQLFYQNGGGVAYVTSIGTYGAPVALADFQSAIAALRTLSGIPLVVIPDAVLLDDQDHATLTAETLAICAETRATFAIVDLREGGLFATLAAFRAAMLTTGHQANWSYGAAYAPWLIPTSAPQPVPPSGAIAGLYASTDVWSAVANLTPAGVADVVERITAAQQELMVNDVSGLTVDAIRSFPGAGVKVWGARTLDANSQDYRYIQVRRTIIYIEQSIRQALNQFVFEPNDENTWIAIRDSIERFLTGLWQSGALMGATTRDAFNVRVGLGSTMTQEDIENGILRVNVLLAMLKPAEFVALQVEQQMTTT